jgi:hypothetical protein
MRYQLETDRPKGVCPQCGHPKRFRFFQDTQTGMRLPSYFGRCDRENSCGYFRRPDNNLGDFADRSMLKNVDPNIVNKSRAGYHRNTFFRFLERTFDAETALQLCDRYEIGSARGNKTVFWYKDELGFYRNAKVYAYLDTGKRDKTIDPMYKFTKNQGYSIPLYGSHLIPYAKERGLKKIAVVESEKSAVIGSYASPEAIFLASGGSKMLTDERCWKLKKFAEALKAEIHLFCDADLAGRDGFAKAHQKLQNLGIPAVLHDLFPERDDGYDIADWFLENAGNIA